MAHDVFISYSTKDKTIADAVCAKLEENNIRAWIAPRDVPPGTNFAEAIVNAISSAKVFVLIWSGNANSSKHILNEINRAFDLGIPIIPFRIQEVTPSSAMSYYLSNTHWLDAYQPSWKAHLTKLFQTIQANLGPQSTADQSQPAAADQTLTASQRPAGKSLLLGLAGLALALLAVWFGLSKLNILNGLPGLSDTSKTEPTQTAPGADAEESQEAPIPSSTVEMTAAEEEKTCQIMFQSVRDGELQLWLMAPDGGNPTQLSFSQASDLVGSWTPDGEEFVFTSWRDGDSEIYLMNISGSNIRQLTVNQNIDVMPKLSPDGGRIAFYSDRTGSLEIHVMDRDGENLTQLTTSYGWYGNQDYGFVMASLDWSPDSQKLVFTSDQEGNPDLFTMSNTLEGEIDLESMKSLSDLSEAGSWEIEPVWSPDGHYIAYVSDRYGDFEIFLFDTNELTTVQLTSNNGISSQPAWSPDGTKIAFTSDRSGDSEIWTMDADGSNQNQITDSEGYDGGPVWSPLCRDE